MSLTSELQTNLIRPWIMKNINHPMRGLELHGCSLGLEDAKSKRFQKGEVCAYFFLKAKT